MLDAKQKDSFAFLVSTGSDFVVNLFPTLLLKLLQLLSHDRGSQGQIPSFPLYAFLSFLAENKTHEFIDLWIHRLPRSLSSTRRQRRRPISVRRGSITSGTH